MPEAMTDADLLAWAGPTGLAYLLAAAAMGRDGAAITHALSQLTDTELVDVEEAFQTVIIETRRTFAEYEFLGFFDDEDFWAFLEEMGTTGGRAAIEANLDQIDNCLPVTVNDRAALAAVIHAQAAIVARIHETVDAHRARHGLTATTQDFLVTLARQIAQRRRTPFPDT
jgi:hypothetical protein